MTTVMRWLAFWRTLFAMDLLHWSFRLVPAAHRKDHLDYAYELAGYERKRMREQGR